MVADTGADQRVARVLDTPTFVEGFQHIVEYADITAALKEPSMRVLSDRFPAELAGRTLMTIDGDEHFARRRLEAQMFAAGSLVRYEREMLRPQIERFMQECRDMADSSGVAHVDLVPFGFSMLARMGAALAGVDGVDTPAQAERLIDQVDRMVKGIAVLWSKAGPSEAAQIIEAGMAAQHEFKEEFFTNSIDRRSRLVDQVRSGELDASKLPRDILTSLLLHRDQNWDEALPLREIATNLAASIGTSARILNHGADELLRWFDAHPGSRSEAATDPAFLQSAIQDVLRLHPVLPALMREATQDVVLPSGRNIRAGERVALLFAVANRDPKLFGEDAEEFVPDRANRVPNGRMHGLAFGAGPHTCIGRRLVVGGVRVEGEAPTDGTVTTLLRALFTLGMERDAGNPPVGHSASFYDDFDSFPVRLPTCR
jgi:cytochrome P450